MVRAFTIYFSHVKKRAKERYGIDLDINLYKNWNKIIRENYADLICNMKDPNNPTFTDSLYKLYYRDKTVIAVYSHAYSLIKTVFPDNEGLYRNLKS